MDSGIREGPSTTSTQCRDKDSETGACVRTPASPPGTSIAAYLDAIRYRRYTRSVLVERRRFLTLATVGGTDAWFMTAPVEEVVAAVRARSRIRSKANLQKIRSAVEDYRRWRRTREGPSTAPLEAGGP